VSESPQTERYANLEVKMVCPNCRSGGMIPWKQLERVLICRGCGNRYRVEASGLVALPQLRADRIRLQVRTNSSAWSDHSAVLMRSPDWGTRLRDAGWALLLRGYTRWVLAGVLLASLCVPLAFGSRAPAPPAPLVIPDELDGRAALLAQSLARRDMAVLIRLTDPEQHRALRIWLAHASDLPGPYEATETVPKPEVLSPGVSPGGDQADVRVRLPADEQHPEVVLDEHWTRRNEIWYFQPQRLRAAAPVRTGPVRPYVKPTRRVR
jgi:hypothetical protein